MPERVGELNDSRPRCREPHSPGWISWLEQGCQQGQAVARVRHVDVGATSHEHDACTVRAEFTVDGVRQGPARGTGARHGLPL